ncbi:MAG: transglutaminase domain-containing protein, partial [Proteobacteria bacterium]|nr:transglutaminase domain-containing protein [Pseudomonadota bacterium]
MSFVALCRYAGIPARAVAGYRWEHSRWSLHVWAEFYVHGLGWIPC